MILFTSLRAVLKAVHTISKSYSLWNSRNLRQMASMLTLEKLGDPGFTITIDLEL